MSYDLTHLILGYFLAVNVLAFVIASYDKLAAMNFWWRVSEDFQLTLSFLGGAPAAKLAQIFYRHKMLRVEFTASLNLIAFFHLGLAAAIWSTTQPFIGNIIVQDVVATASATESDTDDALPRRFGPGS